LPHWREVKDPEKRESNIAARFRIAFAEKKKAEGLEGYREILSE
jgi:hypothetical protein